MEVASPESSCMLRPVTVVNGTRISRLAFIHIGSIALLRKLVLGLGPGISIILELTFIMYSSRIKGFGSP